MSWALEINKTFEWLVEGASGTLTKLVSREPDILCRVTEKERGLGGGSLGITFEDDADVL